MEAAQGQPQRLTASLALTVAPAVPAGAQIIGRRPARRQVTGPDASVRQVIRNNCTVRHSIDEYAAPSCEPFLALDRAGCQALLQSKHKDRGCRVAEDDRNLLFDWLAARFGPGK